MPAAQVFLVMLTLVDIVFPRPTRIVASMLSHVAERRASRA
jgi:hypothetical protein